MLDVPYACTELQDTLVVDARQKRKNLRNLLNTKAISVSVQHHLNSARPMWEIRPELRHLTAHSYMDSYVRQRSYVNLIMQ